MFDINQVPPFWQGVLASIVAAAILGALTTALPFARSRASASRERRLRQIADLRRKMMSADAVARVEAYFLVLCKLLRYLFVGSIFWVLGEIAAPVFYPAIFLISFTLVAFVLGFRWLTEVTKPATTDESVPSGGKLMIVAAEYGAGTHLVDVTESVRKSVAHGRLRLYVGNQLGGDPCPGLPKVLRVQYEYNGTPCVREVPELEDLSLP